MKRWETIFAVKTLVSDFLYMRVSQYVHLVDVSVGSDIYNVAGFLVGRRNKMRLCASLIGVRRSVIRQPFFRFLQNATR